MNLRNVVMQWISQSFCVKEHTRLHILHKVSQSYNESRHESPLHQINLRGARNIRVPLFCSFSDSHLYNSKLRRVAATLNTVNICRKFLGLLCGTSAAL